MKCIYYVLAVIVALVPAVTADTFVVDYGGTTLTNVTVSPGEHTFEVDSPFGFTKNTEWYVTYSGGSPVEVDSSSVQNPSFTKTFSAPGTYWVRAEVYDSGWNWEEAHRWEVAIDGIAPDLTSFITLPPGTYQPGDTISGTINVSNVGDGTAAAGYIDLFLNLGSPSYSPTDQIEHEYYFPIFAAGSDSSSFNYTIPISTPPGTYYLTSLADATDTSSESNEDNNKYQTTITILGQPDLIVEDIWTEPSTVEAGSNYVIKALIRNIGGETASVSPGSQDARFYLDGTPVGADTYDNVDPDGTVVVQTGILTGPSTGTYPIRVEADYNDEVDEASESNNDRTENLIIGSPSLPDLIVDNIWIDPDPVSHGESFLIYARIRNIGDAMASAGAGTQYARFRIGGGTIDNIPYDDVPAGGSVTIQTSTISGSILPGNHSVQVIADYYDDVVESNESNNDRTEIIDWVAPDLVVQSITVNPGYAWRPSTITAVIRNQGTALAEFGFGDRICRFEVDGQVDYDTVLLLPVTIPPGGIYAAEETFTVSSLGSFSVTALADPDNEIVEESEGNNSRTESETWTASTIHDTDGDGMIDADEVLAGSEPDNSNSVWQCSLVLTNGGFRLSWPSVSGRTYTVMRTTNLTNDFTAISPPLPGMPPANWFESVNMPSNAFYRVEVRQ